jgi:ABC-type sugar transport system ATPase subunit
VKNQFEEKELTLGFRPEAIQILDEPSNLQGNARVKIRLEVISSEFAGPNHRLRGKIGLETIRFDVRAWEAKQFVQAELDLSEALFFDPETGRSLHIERVSRPN